MTKSIALGIPAPPPPVLAPRRKTRQLMVRDVGVGSDYPIAVQSMCTTKTHDVNSTLQQIAELTAAGCDIVRVACPRQEDADALSAIAKKSQLPVIADIHFQPKYIFAAIDAGCAAVRVNPGNIKEFDGRVKEVAKAAADAGIPIRIGVNAGSLDKRMMEKYGKATPEALVESALWEASLFEEHGFGNIKISVKHNDPVIMVEAYQQLAAQCDYPLHLGVTEAGPAFQGTIKSAVAFGALLHHFSEVRLIQVVQGSAVVTIAGSTARPVVTPAACRCRPRPSKRSRSATRSSNRSTCARVGSRSCRARPAGVRRSTSTSWPTRSPPGWRASTCRCGWPSWGASSTDRGRRAKPTSEWRPVTARARYSFAARSSRRCRNR